MTRKTIRRTIPMPQPRVESAPPTTAPPYVDAPGGDAVEQAITGVERLYQAVTGRTPPASDETYSPIPVEKDPAEVVAERVDRLLDALGAVNGGPFVETASRWSPPLTVWEDERGLLLCFDVAGVSRRDLEVTLEGDVLSVTGKRPRSKENMRLRGSERPLGSFARQVVLPRGTAANLRGGELQAQLREGVLEIVLPQKHDAKSSEKRAIAVV
jgi:HSP20 family protein